MNHCWWLACICLLLTGFPAGGGADEITDAMTSPDPRLKLQSGTGRVYESRYGTPEDELPPAEEPELELPGFEYQRSELYDRSPLDEPLDEPLHDADFDALSDDDPYATAEDLPPLGKPYARPGVYYQDDLELTR